MGNWKDKAYDFFVCKNENIKEEYENYVKEHMEEHADRRGKHWSVLVRLNWHYRVMRRKNLLLDGVCREKSGIPFADTDYELVKNSKYFDVNWYLETYRDIKKAKIDPVKHYMTTGWKEFRRPGPSFSTLLYLNRYADASAMGIDPLLHYEKIGKREKRVSSYKSLYKSVAREIQLIEQSKFFDAAWYQKKYLENDVSCEKPSVHYFCIGCYWGYDPSAAFSSKLYKQEFPNVRNLPYLLHYETYSKKHGKGYFNLSAEYYSNKELYTNVIDTAMNALLQMLPELDRKKVLLISHSLDLTGAPRVLFEMALVLKKQGFYPVIMTINEGALMDEIVRAGIPVVIGRNYEKPELFDNMRKFVQMFDFTVFSTVESLKFAHILKYTRSYKVAWVHEGEETLKNISEKQKYRINLMDEIYTGSEYCNRFFRPYIEKKEKLSVLYYGIDHKEICAYGREGMRGTDKIVFIVAGTIGYRKGHHILAEAIRNLEEEILRQIEIWIVGNTIDKEVGEEINVLAEEHEEIKLFGQVENDKLMEMIAASDVLLCPSIDDPLPVVVTDAFILNIPVIVTDMVGTSVFIENEKNGFVIKAGSSIELQKIIEKIATTDFRLHEIGKRGYQIYEKNLSYTSFEKKIREIFDEGKIRNGNLAEGRSITNRVDFLDLQVSSSGYTFIFSCDMDNQLCILNDGVVYEEGSTEDKKWVCLNTYLGKEDKRVAVIMVKKASLMQIRLMVASKTMDTIDLRIGDNTWIVLNQLAKKDFCIWMNENVFSFVSKAEYYERITNNSRITETDRNLVRKAANIREYKYNLYCETRNNMNDNAYMLFLYDLKTNPNAYFLTTRSNYERETDEMIKEHLLILNTPKAKEYMMNAKRIISSWYAPMMYGYTRMLLLYPFLNLNYIFVPHGISYDKDSYYLNTALWGNFSKTICSSELEKTYFEECNGYKNVKVLGYPRMDKWIESSMDEKLVLIFPSWRDVIDEHYIAVIIDICEKIVKALPEMKIAYLAHPSVEKKDYLMIVNRLKQITAEIIAVESEDRETFNKYFSEAKYLVTDYSSVAYDFAYKSGIPIYYEPFIDEKVHYHMNEMFKEHNCGVSCASMEQVIDILRNSSNEALRKRADEFYLFHDNHNTERVYKEIMSEE